MRLVAPRKPRSDRMPLGAHLKELRRRVVLIAIGLLLGSIIGWMLFDPVFEALQKPVLDAQEKNGSVVEINFSGLATGLDMRVKVAFFLSVILTSPWWIYQLWAFIAPGLKNKEKRYTIGFLFAAIPMFGGGVALGWLIFPRAVTILTEFTPSEGLNILDAPMYLNFVMRLLIAFGLAFVFPVLMVGLTWGGLVSSKTWLNGWRWAVVAIFAFAAVMTPTPDALTMIFMAVPICALYFAGIGVGRIHEKRRKKVVA